MCGKDDMIFPCWTRLPMGFSWSLFFAQVCGEHLLDSVVSLRGSQRLSDCGPSVVLRQNCSNPVAHSLYVDNFFTLGVNCLSEVQQALDDGCEAFRSVGLLVHEIENASCRLDPLGVTLDGDRCQSQLNAKRYYLLRCGVRSFLRRRSVTGDALRRVV